MITPRLLSRLPRLAALAVLLPLCVHAEASLDAVVPPAPVQAATDAFTYTRLRDGVQIRVNGIVKNVLFHAPDIVRVNTTLGESHAAHPSLTVVLQPPGVPFQVDATGDHLELTTAALQVSADKRSGALTFLRPDGTVITREKAARQGDIREVIISGEPTYEVKQTFTLAPDESLYGLGQYDKRYMDYRGQEVLLVQTNIGIVIPFLISTNRYGVLWDACSKTTFKDDASGATFWSESSPAGVDYYFMAGDTMDGVIASYRRLTGAAPMYPKSAFGLFMSKERYPTQDRLIEVVRDFRGNGFPIDYIVQDWQYWGGTDGTWSGMIWNKERFPDPARLTRTLHDELHVKLMNSIWPSVGDDTELARELDAKNLRFAPLHWISRKARIYDAFSPEGRAIYFKHVKKGLLDVGVDALWMDGTEVEVGGACHDPAEVERDIKGLGKNAMGDFTRYLNPYSLMTTRGVYEGQRATGDKRVLTLTRSAWTGQQRYAALSWSGDTTASWDVFRDQISGGLNVAMAGQPYWTQDTGGFFIPGGMRDGAVTTPEYNELFARWHQFGAFNPVYRIHGTDIEREPYVFAKSDPGIYASLLSAARLRYRLIPYIYGLAWRSTADGYTMMRGLPMDFPDDLAARRLDDEFMFGPAFLVHPVTRPMHRVPPPPAPTIPAGAFTMPDGRPGVAVEYFKGRDFSTPVSKVVENNVDQIWPGPPLTAPPPGLDNTYNFSDRWEATITMPEDGEYEIGAEGDDGVRVWLDGRLVIDDWSIHPMRWRSRFLAFRKGQKVALKIEHFQGDGGRGLRLGWKTPGFRARQSGQSAKDDTAETYLPAGADWYDFWTNQRHAGGRTVKQSVPLDRMPLFVRAGSIVPMSPVMQYVTEQPAAPYEIRIYPGADATFTLYEDDNETYAYERGEGATVELTWDDRARALTVGQRRGSFPGMVRERELRVVIATPATGVGVEPAAPPAKVVRYTGKTQVLKF